MTPYRRIILLLFGGLTVIGASCLYLGVGIYCAANDLFFDSLGLFLVGFAMVIGAMLVRVG